MKTSAELGFWLAIALSVLIIIGILSDNSDGGKR